MVIGKRSKSWICMGGGDYRSVMKMRRLGLVSEVIAERVLRVNRKLKGMRLGGVSSVLSEVRSRLCKQSAGFWIDDRERGCAEMITNIDKNKGKKLRLQIAGLAASVYQLSEGGDRANWKPVHGVHNQSLRMR